MSRGGFSPQEALCLGLRYPDTLLHLGCPEILSPQVCLGSRPPNLGLSGEADPRPTPTPHLSGEPDPHLLSGEPAPTPDHSGEPAPQSLSGEPWHRPAGHERLLRPRHTSCSGLILSLGFTSGNQGTGLPTAGTRQAEGGEGSSGAAAAPEGPAHPCSPQPGAVLSGLLNSEMTHGIIVFTHPVLKRDLVTPPAPAPGRPQCQTSVCRSSCGAQSLAGSCRDALVPWSPGDPALSCVINATLIRSEPHSFQWDSQSEVRVAR